MSYTGSVELISGITPKNGQGFPLVNAPDVYVDDTHRLPDALSDMHDEIDGQISELRNDLENTKDGLEGVPLDIVQLYGGIVQKTHNGVTFTPTDNGSACIVNGTASNTAFDNIFYNISELPVGVKAGADVRFVVNTTNTTALRCVVMFYDANGTEITPTQYVQKDRILTIPSNAVGMLIRVQVTKNTVMDNDKISIFIFPAIYDSVNWTEFKERIDPALINKYQYDETSANDISFSGWCFCNGASVANCPDNTHAFWILTLKLEEASTTRMQTAVDWSSGLIYYRKFVSGNWSEWVNNPLVKDDFVKNNHIYSGNNANDITENSWYFCNGNTVSNCPDNTNAFIVLSIIISQYSKMQLAYCWTNGKRYFRRYQSNSWQSWTTYNEYTDFVKNNHIYSGNNANDIAENSWYFCDGATISNCPDSAHAYLVQTIIVSQYAKIQIAYDWTNGKQYYRRYQNNVWQSWSSGIYNLDVSYRAFGDSLTYGAVWIPNGADKTIIRADIEYQMPTRIAKAIGCEGSFENSAIGGMAYVPDVEHGTTESSILDCIKSYDLSNTSFITVAGGRNDAYNSLGTSSSSVADGTVCGAIKEVIEYLRNIYPFLEFVIIGCTPSAASNSAVWTTVYPGGWSLNDFDTQVSKICDDYGVGYIDWKECQYVHHWADYTGAGGNRSHPNTQRAYMQMGNYLGGKVSRYYHGN